MIVGEICIATNKVYTIMNYLAHLYLSGESDEIKLGNFIGDYVKGNKHQKFPDQVAFGIKLHRRIDSFTDHHPDVNECKQILTSGYGRYSGVVVDIFFDHFLAVNWSDYSLNSLSGFSKQAHVLFLSNYLMLPLRVKQFLPFLIHNNRFESYANKESIPEVLDIMSRRTSLPDNSQWALQMLNQEYDQFEQLFRHFFDEIVAYVESDFGIEIIKTQ